MSRPAFTPTAEGMGWTVHNRDCVTGMEELVDAEAVDVVVTSPPYNLGIAYRSYDDTIGRTEYLDWIRTWADAVHRVLARKGSLFLNIAGKPSDPWGPFDVLSRLRTRFVLQNTIHWIKAIAIDAPPGGAGTGATTTAIGHYKPINSQRYVNDCHEYIFHLTKLGDVPLNRTAIGVPYQDKSNIGRWKSAGADRRCRGNTWLVPYRTISKRQRDRPHPATFPLDIPRMCVQLHGLERTTLVMDPFLGLGSTALVVRHVIIFGYGHGLQRAIIDESQHRTPERLIMAQH